MNEQEKEAYHQCGSGSGGVQCSGGIFEQAQADAGSFRKYDAGGNGTG